MQASLRIGIDIGGTFTDFVVYDPQQHRLATFKLLSTPADPSEAVMEGLARLGILAGEAGSTSPSQITIIHGSTVATNALLERKGARTAFVATAGFKDLLQIGRQNRPELYDFFADPPDPLVPPELRFEVDERVDRDGQVLRPLDAAAGDGLIEALRGQGATSVAVCLLFSFLYPQHERLVSESLRQAGFLVSVSSEILPEFREYERASTTAVNAYVSPVLMKYLASLEERLADASAKTGSRVRLRIMQSNGGNIGPAEARQFGVRCILSGPAGGVVGCQYAAKALGEQHPRLITFDMGGTSTDVSLIDGGTQLTSESNIGGCPIRIPVLDIHTIGAGGGSIASVDPGGALRVGPQSAGADPGPACYPKPAGSPLLPTVTDANLVLGRLVPEYFLGGKMALDSQAAQRALARLAQQAGLSVDQAALGVVEVADAHMERALRVMSVERGHDPRDFSLLSFGGAGGLHAANLARRLGIPRVLVPPLASTLSAYGMLVADVVKDYSLTVMKPGDTPLEALQDLLAPLVSRGRQEVAAEGVPAERVGIRMLLDMRYQGQSFELTIPFKPGFIDGFHAAHEQAYGYARRDAPTEIVNLRVQATGQTEPPPLQAEPLGDEDASPALLGTRSVRHDALASLTPLYRAESLLPGNHIMGPALIVRADTTVLLAPTDTARVDGFGNLIIRVGGEG